jgi:hypothetical protein
VADLSGVWAKFNHAKSHLETLDRLWVEYLNTYPYRVRVKFDPEAKVNRFMWVVRSNIPMQLSLNNGDFWYNLRASLDYLAWQLVLANNQQPSDKTSFPCAKSPESWASAVGKDLKGIDPYWVNEIDNLQPYHRGNALNEHPLFLLDSFNNANKHRIVPPVIATPEPVGWTMPADALPDEARVEPLSHVRVEDGAEIVRFWCDERIDLPDMDVNPGSVFRISWDDGSGFEWDTDTVLDWVEHAITIFKPAFASQGSTSPSV